MHFRKHTLMGGLVVAALAIGTPPQTLFAQEPWRFHLQEATIADVHRAIREGQITCRQLVHCI
jgi:hypothetical protein